MVFHILATLFLIRVVPMTKPATKLSTLLRAALFRAGLRP